MKIYIAGSLGHGSTPLSAFDDALANIGALNYNLIPLSSIIPPNSTIIPVPSISSGSLGGQFGDRLYVVKAEQCGSKKGEAVGAAIGWYLFDDNRGLFFEQETTAMDEHIVQDVLRRNVTESLRELCLRRHIPFSEERVGMKVATGIVGETPACAMVIATFAVAPWSV